MPPSYDHCCHPCRMNPSHRRAPLAAMTGRLPSWLMEGRGLPLFALCAVLQAVPLAAAAEPPPKPTHASSAPGNDQPQTFNIPAGEAAIALKKFSEQSGLSVMFAPERVEGVKTKEVVGQMSTRAALDRLLAGTTLYAIRTKEPGAYAIRSEGRDRPNG